jgi:microcystin-dependent protein
MNSYIGSIYSFGFNYAPQGWQLCDGTLLPIANNEPLYALIGTYYGGDGVSNFAVPDLRGRIPVGAGQGPGLSNYLLGQPGGSTQVSLTVSNIPAHTHAPSSVTIPVSGNTDVTDPTNAYFGLADASFFTAAYSSTFPPTSTMAANSVNSNPTGSGVPFNIQSPFQAVNYCICVEGLFPPRS